MSLLADLLSNIKYRGENRDVPPGLKRIVSDSTDKDAVRKKIVISALLAVLAIAGGVAAVYVSEIYLKPSVKVTASQPIRVGSGTGDSVPKIESTEKVAQQKQFPASIPVPPPASERTESQHPRIDREPKASGARQETELMRKQKSDIKVQQPVANVLQRESEVLPEIARIAEAKREEFKISKGDRDLYLYTARTHESRKEYQQAFHNYSKALEVDSGNYIILNNISSILLHMRNPEEAIKYSKNALAIRKDYVPSLVNLGISYIMTGKLAEGEGYLAKALSIEPLNSNAMLNIGLLFEKRGDYDKAYGYFFRLSEMGDIQGHLGIARVLEKQGNRANAARVYRDIISINGVAPDIKKLANERLLQLGQ